MSQPMVFLVSCDKRIESEVSSLISALQKASDGKFKIMTFKNVPIDGKGADFGKKLGNFLQFAKSVLIICSDNLGNFIDKNKTENCPDIIKNEKKKNCPELLKSFFKKQMETAPNKIIVISVTGNEDLPNSLAGRVAIVKKTSTEDAFVNQIITQIQGIM